MRSSYCKICKGFLGLVKGNRIKYAVCEQCRERIRKINKPVTTK